MKRRAAPLLVCAAVAVAWYVFLALELHHDLYATRDSQGYRAAALWLYRQGGSDAVLRYRPVLYPLWLGFWRSIGDNAVWASNFVCWLATIGFSALAAFRLSGRRAAMAVFAVIAINISLIDLTFFALTEVLTTFLLALWLVAFVSTPFRQLTAVAACAVVLPLSLGALVKPSLEVQTALIVLLLAALRPRRSAWLGVTAGLIPIAGQLIFMWVHFRYLGISDIAGMNFEAYVAPYANNVPTLIEVSLRNLIAGNILQVSKFVAPPWQTFTFVTNCAYFVGNLVLAPILAIRIWRERSQDLVKAGVVYAMAVIVVIGTVIAEGGGDRLVVVALPLWVVALSVLMADGRVMRMGEPSTRDSSEPVKL